MGLGGCILLIAAGAILTFASDWEMRGVDLDVVGLILMAAGLIGVATYTSIARRRRLLMGPHEPVVEEDRPHHHHHHTY
ncbi:hypothetical protein [Streptomyces sp. Da 82-17]|uniref:hypothetical protein n=1 Tax=Streptomyces sp. Da 82-17 TaxID=3377116 RepID=UPI0038D40B7F